MTRPEAEALAQKREAHKSKHMTEKEWRAVHDSVKGWHAALVDSRQHLLRVEQEARQRARQALMSGDGIAFYHAASDALLASVKREIGDAA